MKIAFGRNSATNKIIIVEKIVFRMSIISSEPRSGDNIGPRILEKIKP